MTAWGCLSRQWKNLDPSWKAEARNIPVLFRNEGTSVSVRNTADYDAVFPRLAKKYDVLFYPFFLEGVALDPSLVQPDGLHPNPNGVDAIVTRITPLAVQLVQQAQKQQAGNQTK